MVRNKLHWDANYAVGLPKQRNRLSFVLEVPLRNLRPSVIYSVHMNVVPRSTKNTNGETEN